MESSFVVAFFIKFYKKVKEYYKFSLLNKLMKKMCNREIYENSVTVNSIYGFLKSERFAFCIENSVAVKFVEKTVKRLALVLNRIYNRLAYMEEVTVNKKVYNVFVLPLKNYESLFCALAAIMAGYLFVSIVFDLATYRFNLLLIIKIALFLVSGTYTVFTSQHYKKYIRESAICRLIKSIIIAD